MIPTKFERLDRGRGWTVGWEGGGGWGGGKEGDYIVNTLHNHAAGHVMKIWVIM